MRRGEEASQGDGTGRQASPGWDEDPASPSSLAHLETGDWRDAFTVLQRDAEKERRKKKSGVMKEQ